MTLRERVEELVLTTGGPQYIADAILALVAEDRKNMVAQIESCMEDIRTQSSQLAEDAEDRRELVEALKGYMSQFGQALFANGIPFGPAQMEAYMNARAALAKVEEGA